jgi:hypothetical protein
MIYMKKIAINLFALVLGAGALIFQSCGDGTDDPETGPTVDFIADAGYTSSDATLTGGVPFTIGINASSDVRIDKVEILVSYDGGVNAKPDGCTICDTTINDNNARIVYNGETRTVEGNEKWTFRVTDRNGGVTSKSITITTSKAVTEDLQTFTEDNNGDPFRVWNVMGPNAGAFDLVNGVAQLAGNPPNDKDIVDDTESSDLPNWPGEWVSANGSLFLLAQNSFASYIGTEQLSEEWGTSSGNARITPQTGEVYIVKLRGQDTWALVEITDRVTTTTDNRDYIEFNFKKKRI